MELDLMKFDQKFNFKTLHSHLEWKWENHTMGGKGEELCSFVFVKIC